MTKDHHGGPKGPSKKPKSPNRMATSYLKEAIQLQNLGVGCRFWGVRPTETGGGGGGVEQRLQAFAPRAPARAMCQSWALAISATLKMAHCTRWMDRPLHSDGCGQSPNRLAPGEHPIQSNH